MRFEDWQKDVNQRIDETRSQQNILQIYVAALKGVKPDLARKSKDKKFSSPKEYLKWLRENW